jgi:hypothetical protein
MHALCRTLCVLRCFSQWVQTILITHRICRHNSTALETALCSAATRKQEADCAVSVLQKGSHFACIPWFSGLYNATQYCTTVLNFTRANLHNSTHHRPGESQQKRQHKESATACSDLQESTSISPQYSASSANEQRRTSTLQKGTPLVNTRCLQVHAEKGRCKTAKGGQTHHEFAGQYPIAAALHSQHTPTLAVTCHSTFFTVTH